MKQKKFAREAWAVHRAGDASRDFSEENVHEYMCELMQFAQRNVLQSAQRDQEVSRPSQTLHKADGLSSTPSPPPALTPLVIKNVHEMEFRATPLSATLKHIQSIIAKD